MRSWLARRIAPAAFADAERQIAAAQHACDFWRGEYERVVSLYASGLLADEARRAAIERLARKVEAKRRAA